MKKQVHIPVGVALLVLLLLVSACASKQPVFYPNSRYLAVGKQVAKLDAKDCQRLARDAGADSDKAADVGKQAATGAAVGGAAAGAWGLVRGDAGNRAAAGAAAGAATGVTRGIIESDEPNAVFKRFVERCLYDRGYDVIGWR